jgi:hypothetical protein
MMWLKAVDGRSRRGGMAPAPMLLLVACLAVLPHAGGQFFGISDDLSTPPTVRASPHSLFHAQK